MVDVAQLVEPPDCDSGCRGSSPVVHPTPQGAGVEKLFVGKSLYGPLAQLVEQLTLNQLVVGSIPTRPTNSLKNNKFFDVTRKNLKSLPHRSEFPPFE